MKTGNLMIVASIGTKARPIWEDVVNLICLDLEGVLVPEIWISVAKSTGIRELELTTRDEPDYDKLMKYRLDILNARGIRLGDIQSVIGAMSPLDGAYEFLDSLRSRWQVIILSDTFEQFAKPLMKALGWPALFCNTLITDVAGRIIDYKLRMADGKRETVRALSTVGLRIAAVGDSYNDLGMIDTADFGVLFSPPETIRSERPEIVATDTYAALEEELRRWATLA